MKADPHDRITSSGAVRGADRRKSLLLITLAALMSGGGIIVYLYRPSPYAISSEVAAHLDPKTQMTAQRLVNEPCNRTLAADLVSGLFEHDEYAAIIAFSEHTTAKCGPNEELLSYVLRAQYLSSDFSGADRTANQLVAQYPADPTAYNWRAQAREKLGNVVGAYADMRTTLSLFLDPSDVALSAYYDVARLAAKTGHPCDAMTTLRDYIAYDPDNRRTQQLATMMRGWQQMGACAPLSGVGRAFVRFDPNATVKVVSVLVNGVPARLVVDTGASRPLLSKQFAMRAEVEAIETHIVNTANGEVAVLGGRANSISLGDARLNSVPVFIQDSTSSLFSKDVDGLLGMSFLGNFHYISEPGFLQLSPLE
jgi:Aspartyl protease